MMRAPGPDPRSRCVRCNGVVDPRGVDPNVYCLCACRWPVLNPGTLQEVRGCGRRIYFIVNQNGKQQPFNLDDGLAHHSVCKPFLISKQDPERWCPRCGGRRLKGSWCRHCGWAPPGVEPKESQLVVKGVPPLEGFR